MTTQDSIDNWRRLSARESYLEDQDERAGQYSGVHRKRADLYERAARALELQRETGEPYCCCHLRPLREMQAEDAAAAGGPAR